MDSTIALRDALEACAGLGSQKPAHENLQQDPEADMAPGPSCDGESERIHASHYKADLLT